MSYKDKKERNQNARAEINNIKVSHGVQYKFLATTVGMSSNNFNNWRSGLFDFGEDKLKQVNNLIDKYPKL